MLNITNIDTMVGKCFSNWKIHLIWTEPDYYNIKIMRTGSSFDMFNITIERQRTKHGDYRSYCQENGNEYFLPLESFKDSSVLTIITYNLI